MATKLSKAAVERAIDHLVRFGDTDILPLACEDVFLAERREQIAREISSIDLDSFRPVQAIEMIAPKSRYGFRIVHQLPMLETLLFTASIIQIGGDLEQLKRPIEEYGPFAYRFDSKGEASLYVDGHGWHDWLKWQSELIAKEKFSDVIFTDIADFYQRIYLHRLENILDSATDKKGINKFIVKLIKQVRSKQSHGIPVGGSAARILAEAALTDTDSSLADDGIIFTRYMDDFRIFVREDQSAYQILASLAEQLATSDGLSLNAQKTRVHSATSFQNILNRQIPDVFDEAQQAAIDALSHALYFDELPDKADIDKLRSLNLLEALEEEIAKEFWDFSRIRSIFLGLRVTEDDNATQYLAERLPTFTTFIKEMVLFFDIMHAKGKLDDVQIGEAVYEELHNGAAQSVPTIRVWLLEMYVRGCLEINNKKLNAIEGDDTPTNRQVYMTECARPWYGSLSSQNQRSLPSVPWMLFIG